MKHYFTQTVHLLCSCMNGSYQRSVARKCLVYTLLMIGTAHADSENIIYYEAPPPDEIADILFQPHYRGIVFSEKPDRQPAQNMFGMLINFEFDSVKLLPDSLPMLDAIGRMMRLERTAGKRIVIEGHADAVGKSVYNQHLSERRARAIKRYLTSRFNIKADRLVTIGKGESEPHDRANPRNPVNRRVQFRPLS
ncbi:MAG: OmpA family protein [Candidatus Thiodiazotropha sp. (ex Monitilora ramsayi)]|nr:OmpA family protein [Candidatus Thiodiazotropha sp. (ex Monitilora ramsayi)]